MNKSLRTERKAGELITGLDRAKGKRNGDYRPTSVHDEPRLTLKEQLKDKGISETQGKRWQALAEVPKQEFEQEPKYRCSFCFRNFYSSLYLKTHMARHAPEVKQRNKPKPITERKKAEMDLLLIVLTVIVILL